MNSPSGYFRFVSSLTLCVIFGGLCQFAGASFDMFKPSVNEQIKLGEQAAADLRKQSTVLPATDPRVIELRKVANKIVATFPKKEPWHYSFDVIDSNEVNAFALPGGPMFFYTGLFSKLTTEDELAGVIGHELTHVRRQHWAKAYGDSEKRQLGLTALLMIVHVGQFGSDLASVANSFYDLQYSRGDEGQADEGGFIAMTAAGYNPQGMIDLFKTFEKIPGSGGPEFASDHPSDAGRIHNIELLIKKSGKDYPPQIPLSAEIRALPSDSTNPIKRTPN